MPIYEYRCEDCKRRSSLLLRTLNEEARPVCPTCGGRKLKRIFSRFAMVRSEEDRMERLANPSNWSGLDENDPKSMMAWAKRMGKEMGEDVGEDFDAMMEEEMERGGSSPDEPSSED
jgi:putative FmdB family regulatory protein